MTTPLGLRTAAIAISVSTLALTQARAETAVPACQQMWWEATYAPSFKGLPLQPTLLLPIVWSGDAYLSNEPSPDLSAVQVTVFDESDTPVSGSLGVGLAAPGYEALLPGWMARRAFWKADAPLAAGNYRAVVTVPAPAPTDDNYECFFSDISVDQWFSVVAEPPTPTVMTLAGLRRDVDRGAPTFYGTGVACLENASSLCRSDSSVCCWRAETASVSFDAEVWVTDLESGPANHHALVVRREDLKSSAYGAAQLVYPVNGTKRTWQSSYDPESWELPFPKPGVQYCVEARLVSLITGEEVASSEDCIAGADIAPAPPQEPPVCDASECASRSQPISQEPDAVEPGPGDAAEPGPSELLGPHSDDLGGETPGARPNASDGCAGSRPGDANPVWILLLLALWAMVARRAAGHAVR